MGEPSPVEPLPDAAADSWDAVASPESEPAEVDPASISSWDGVAPPEDDADGAAGPGQDVPAATGSSTDWDGMAPAPDAAAASPVPPPAGGRDTTWDATAPPETRPITHPPASPQVRTGATGWDGMAPDGQGQSPPPAGPAAPVSADADASGVADPFADDFDDSISGWGGDAREGGWDVPTRQEDVVHRLPEGAAGKSDPSTALASPHPAIPRSRAGKHRSPWLVFPLCVVTASVYYFVWVYQVCRELRDHLVRERSLSPTVMVGLHFVPLFGAFWPYYVLHRISADVNLMQVLEGHGLIVSPASVLWQAVGGTLVAVAVALLAVKSVVGWVLVAGGLGLWGFAFAQVQRALNEHWALHDR